MMYSSLLLKTFGLAVVALSPAVAAGLWLAGLLLDIPWRRPAGQAGGLPLLHQARSLAWLHMASLVVGMALATGCDAAAVRWKEGVPALAAAVVWLLQAVGVNCGARDGMVFLSTMAGPQEFAVSLDALVIKVPVVFLGLLLVRMLWNSVSVAETLRRCGGCALVLLACAVVRMAAFILMANFVFDFTGYDAGELPYRPFMEESGRMLLWLPLLLVVWLPLSRVFRGSGGEPATASSAPLPRWILLGVLPAATAAGAAVFWQPEGVPKPRIKTIIASGHAQWSQCVRPYDRDWYGADSGYNYACVKRLFEGFGEVALAAGPELTAADLSGATTLVVYDPDRRFTDAERQRICDFVNDGGGLLVIGDHTNVFGSASHLNEVCEPFGFQFRDDVLFDLDQDFHQVLDAPVLKSRAWHGMEIFKLRGPASIRTTSLWTRPVYQVGRSKSVRADYSVNNFFPPPRDDPKMRTGTFCIAANATYGRGRVAAWGDSTVFSNFEIFYPGKYEFLLNTLNWLNHREPGFSPMLRRLALVLWVVGTIALLVLRRSPAVWLATLAFAFTGLWAGWGMARLAEHLSGGFPVPQKPSRWVFFSADTQDPSYCLRGQMAEGPYDQRYEVFTQWVLRTGAMSAFNLAEQPAGSALYQHLRGGGMTATARALIVRKPADLAKLDSFATIPHAKSDPVLLMFASPIGAADAVAAVKRAGLFDTPAGAEAIAAAWPTGETLVTQDGRRVLVVAAAERFSDQMMGISEKVIPDAAQRALFNQAYGLIDRLFGEQSAASPQTPPKP